MHVLVAGAGWLGLEIARRAVARGDRVTAVRRSAGRTAELRAAGAEPVPLDLLAPRALEGLPPAEAIVACQAAGGESLEAYRAAYLAANAALLEAAARWGARMVYTGSTGVFGQRDGTDVDEDSPPAPATATAQVLVEAEQALQDAARAGVLACVVRLSGLYGPGRAGILDRVRNGQLALGPGDGAWMNFCHRDDAAAVVLAAVDRGQAGAVYHGSDASPATRAEVATWVAAALGTRPQRVETPWAGPNRRVLAEKTRRRLGNPLAFPTFREGLAPLLGPGA